MSAFKSIKNKFLVLLFLCLTVVPNIARADTANLNVSAPNASKYYVLNQAGIAAVGTDASLKGLALTALPGGVGILASSLTPDITSKVSQYIDLTDEKDIYSADPTKVKYTPEELAIVQDRLKAGGSTFPVNGLNVDNTFPSNNPISGESIIIYKNPGDGKYYTLGTASASGKVYTLPTPVLLDDDSSKDPSNLNTKTAYGALNQIDALEGMPVGSTVEQKNLESANQQQIIADQQAAQQAALEQQVAEQNKENYLNAGGNDAATIAQMDQAIAQARAGVAAANASSTLSLAQQQAIQAQKAAQAKAAQDAMDGKCNTLGKMASLFCITYVGARMANIVFKLVSFVTYIVGTLFDYSLELSINSAQFIKQLGVVEITWSFLRDILNMTFIFILLWTAIQILLGNSGKYNAKTMLSRVIIVAILMNFSLFAAKIMVDGSNIVSLKIYEAMKATDPTAVPTTTTGTIAVGNGSISERVMTAVGLTTLYNISDVFKNSDAQSCSSDPGAMITISVMGSIFLLIICLALGLAGILFLIRMVNIIYLFIKSPLWVWGYVLPGSGRLSKIKDDWMKQMLHVMTFPIMYLLYMLIGIIVFTKLGSVRNVAANTGAVHVNTGLIDLICSSSATGGSSSIGTTISLVAIFAIVIIFMMKAIEYGVTHVTSGAEGSVGDGAAKWAAGKFSGYQNALTRGLRDKAGKAAVGASVGAAKLPLRVGVGLAQGSLGKETFGKGFRDGFSNPSINAKEVLRDAARKQAINGGRVAGVLGINKAAGSIAAKLDDPKNSAGETRKQAEERRAKKAYEEEAKRYQAIDKSFKIMTQKEWQKKNPTGSLDDYKKHIEETVQKRSDALLGKGIVNLTDSRDKQGRSHIDVMLSNAMKDTTDASGKRSISFSEATMHDSLNGVLEHHTTGEGAQVRSITTGKKRFEAWANGRAESRIKAIKVGTSGSKSKGLGKDAMENSIKVIEKKIQTIHNLPSKDVIEAAIATQSTYTGVGDNEKTIRELNTAVSDLSDPALARDPAKAQKAQAKVEKAKQAYLSHLEKQQSTLPGEQSKLVAKLKAQEEANKK